MGLCPDTLFETVPALTFIDYRSPMDFLELAGFLAPVIAEAKTGRGR